MVILTERLGLLFAVRERLLLIATPRALVVVCKHKVRIKGVRRILEISLEHDLNQPTVRLFKCRLQSDTSIMPISYTNSCDTYVMWIQNKE